MSDLANNEGGKAGGKAGGEAGGKAGETPAGAGQSQPGPDVDEFANIRPATRHPALAVAAALLAFFIVFHVRGDLQYSLSPREPVELGEARTLFSSPVGAAHLAGAVNRTVRVAGTPDRENTLELDTKGSWVFTQFFRVLETGGRLFVHRRENPLPASRVESDVFEGRLVKFGDLSFESAIRSYYRTHVSATHFFRPADLVAALGASSGGTLSLKDVAGEAVTLAPADLLAIDVSRPDEVRLGFPRDKFPDAAAARAEIEKRGGTITGQPKPADGSSEPAGRHAFLARFPPERREAALGALGDLDPKMEIRDARETYKVRVTDISAAGGALALRSGEGAARAVSLAAIPAIRTLAAVQIPDDAYLLVEADLPRDHLRTTIASAVLILFGAVNLIGLLKGIRR